MQQSAHPAYDQRDPTEFASRDEIIALQTARLKTTLHRAYTNVAPMRAKFDQAGVHPDDFRTLADLAKFPLMVKDDLRQAYPFGLFAVPRSEIRRLHASSGTTGKAVVVGYTEADLDVWANLVARSIRAAGGRAGMTAHIAYGYGLFTGGLGAHAGAERLGCAVVPVSGGMTERQVQLIIDFEPQIIMVTPSYGLAILDEFRKRGRDPRATALQIGIFGAEPWSGAMRAELEAGFGIEATDIYGLSEIIGPGVAQECVETKDGPHIWEDHFYPEIIDPLTGAVLPDGTPGELVFTTLSKQAMPIIRYRTRDLSCLLPGTARPGMRRMARITGRSDDMIVLRGVNLFPTQIEEILFEQAWCAGHFVIELSRPHRLDEMLIRAECRPEHWAATPMEDAAHHAAHLIKQRLGVSCTLQIEPPGALERSLGKAKRVIDHRVKF